MKKKYAYSILLILFFGTSAFVVYRFNKNIQKPVFYQLKERKNGLQNNEWQEMEKRWKQNAALAAQQPGDMKSRMTLATIFIEEGRITGDHVYYDAAAMHSIKEVLALEPENFEALSLRSLIELSQHHFSDGLNTAIKAQKINPYNAFVYGLLVDASVELGHYPAAVTYADSMVSIRPDIRSYSRISYLREIHGDQSGAIEAMKMAVDAGIPGDETTEWSRIQLAKLYEETGDVNTAEQLCNLSLSFRPNYPYALAGLGRIATTKKDYSKAIEYFTKADALVNDHSMKEQLAKIYKLTGDDKKATSIIGEMIAAMTKETKQGANDDNIGHYSDRELANAYLFAGDNELALQHALAEYNRRPDNIDVNETLAWVYYNRNEIDKALPYIKVALKTGSKNPTLLSHASLIYSKAGKK